MVKRILCFILVVFGTSASFSSCFHRPIIYELQMSRVPYNGDALRMDGYYYHFDNSNTLEYVDFAIFFRNGVCYYSNYGLEGLESGQDTLQFIDSKLTDKEFGYSYRNLPPAGLGLYMINDSSINLEIWGYLRDCVTYSVEGTIFDRSSFMLTKETLLQIGKTTFTTASGLNFAKVFHFRHLSSKPDSTSVFIK